MAIFVNHNERSPTCLKLYQMDNTTCQVCKKTFTRPYTLKVHLETVHASTRHDDDHEHFCSVCQKGFTRKYDVKRHHEKFHTQQIPTQTATQIPNQTPDYQNLVVLNLKSEII